MIWGVLGLLVIGLLFWWVLIPLGVLGFLFYPLLDLKNLVKGKSNSKYALKLWALIIYVILVIIFLYGKQ